ncbi:MAG TPA: alpha/beta hydrolase [Pirellulales bacterium]|jgi:alpha-beta hydrolase superfamily lysophospholipase|nr:alpha/beta hydrolase [Pirellulales bacterium]
MPQSTGEFATFDGWQLFESSRSPEGRPPRAGVAIVHGYAEHSGRYEEVAGRLLAAGHCVYQFDLRGHGRSEGPRAFVRSFDDYIRDLQTFVERVRPRQAGPLYLLGHSMGGLIAALWTLANPLGASGLVLSGAALKVNDRIHPWLQRMSSAIGMVAPRLPTIRLDDAALSRSAETVRRFREDPLVYHGRMPARTGAEILRAAKRLAPRLAEFRLPLLIMHGGDDRLADPEGSRQLHCRAVSDDKTLKLYPGLFHEIFHEPERRQALDDLVAWLEERG